MIRKRLEALFEDETLNALEEISSRVGDQAMADLEFVLSIFSEPQDHDEIDGFMVRLIIALVGFDPDPVVWLRALSEDGYLLTPRQDYAASRDLHSKARFLKRTAGRLDPEIEGLRRKYAADFSEGQLGVRLVLFSAIMHELRKGVNERSALGVAWPLMVAVDKHFTTEEKRALHHFGGDTRLIEYLAEGAREALDLFLDVEEPGEHEIPATADWRRTLPPRARVEEYFCAGCQRKRVHSVASTKDHDYPNRPTTYRAGRIAELHAASPVLCRSGREVDIVALADRADNRLASMPNPDMPDPFLFIVIRRGVREGYIPEDIFTYSITQVEEAACSMFCDPDVPDEVVQPWRDIGFFLNVDRGEVISLRNRLHEERRNVNKDSLQDLYSSP